MEKFVFVGLFIIACVIAGVSASFGDRCMCSINHPQASYCSSDFVFVAAVRSLERIDGYFVYRMKVSQEKVFKGGELFDRGQRYIDVYTPYDGSLCGRTNLAYLEKYLITGNMKNGHMEMSFCNWVEAWAGLSNIQKGYLKKGKYADQCGDCTISGTVSALEFDHNELEDTFHTSQLSGLWSRFHCSYNPVASMKYLNNDCENDFSYCSRDVSGTCMWKTNDDYETCFRTRETVWAVRDPKAAAFTSARQCRTLSTRRLRKKCAGVVRKYRKALGGSRNAVVNIDRV